MKTNTDKKLQDLELPENIRHTKRLLKELKSSRALQKLGAKALRCVPCMGSIKPQQ